VKTPIIIHGDVLNRENFDKEHFFHSCRNKAEFMKQVGAVYDALQDEATLSVNILVRRANNNGR